MSNPAVAVRIAVFAVAMQARCGSLDETAVDDMRSKAEELLEPGDDLRAAVIEFATQYPVLCHDPYALRLLGAQLQAALDKGLELDAPVRPFRSDIDG